MALKEEGDAPEDRDGVPVEVGAEGAGANEGQPGEGRSQTLEVLPQILWLLTQSSRHKHMTLADMEWYFMPPYGFRQFRVFRKDGVPVAYVCWAFVSDEVEERFKSEWRVNLEAEEWRSGENLWLVDVCAPFGGGDSVLNAMVEEAFKGRAFKFFQPKRDGRMAIFEHKEGSPPALVAVDDNDGMVVLESGIKLSTGDVATLKVGLPRDPSFLWDCVKDVSHDFFSDWNSVNDRESFVRWFRSSVDVACVSYIENEPAGCCYLMGLEPGHRGTFHAFAGKAFRKPEITVPLAKRIIELFIERYDLRKVETVVRIDNRISRLTAARLGFKHEGILRSHGLYNGQWIDHYLWSILRES